MPVTHPPSVADTPGCGRDFAPDEIIDALPRLYATDGTPLADKVIGAKWFTPGGSWTWYAVETDGQTCFGIIDGHERELGYFNLAELASLVTMGGRMARVERDAHFQPATARDLGLA